jgi:hypothetical protein
MIPSAYKDGKLYSVRPVEQLGSELVTNGDFSSASDWTFSGGGVAISGGKLNFTATTREATQSISVVNTKTYRVSYEVSNYSAGSVRAEIGSSVGISRTANGIYSEYIVASGTNVIQIDAVSVFTGSIDNVSVKEVLVANGDFDFSRGSNLAATRVASSGYIEKGRENLLLQSNQFDTTWVKVNTTLTSGQAGYDGTNDAWLVDKSAASARIEQYVSASGVQTLSAYVKAGTLNWTRLNVDTDWAYYDLANGVVGTATGSNIIDHSIEDAGGGWYRCVLVVNRSITTARIYPADADNNSGGTSGNIYIQDAQLESGLVSTSVIKTGASTAQAGILEDMPRLDYSGGATCPSLLLEPQRTNIMPSSEDIDSAWSELRVSVENNNTTSPEGFVNAGKTTATAVAGTHASYDTLNGSVTAGNDYFISCFVKKATTKYIRLNDGYTGAYVTFNFDDQTTNLQNGASNVLVEQHANGWYRLGFKFTADSSGNFQFALWLNDNNNNTSYTGSGEAVYFWGAQLEAGSYATSYIPTYGSSVTRSVDQLETSPYDYQSQGVLGANVGTIILDCETIGTSTGSNDFHMFGATQSIADGYLFRANSGSTIDILERDSNTTSAQWSSIATKQTRNKIAVSYSGADVDIYVNGVAKSVSSGSPVGGGNINGFSNSGSNAAGLIIHQILLFPNKLTDSEMASITTL